MGKDLKGKELGTGLDQRKDGKYRARVTNATGKRKTKCFDKIREAKRWMAEEQSKSVEEISKEITLDELYEIWIELKRKTVRVSTLNSHIDRYMLHIKPCMGNMYIANITTAQCQNLLVKLSNKGYADSSLGMILSSLKNLLQLGVDYGYIDTNPCKSSIKTKLGNKTEPVEALSVFEQKLLTKELKGHRYELQFLFLLQTGLRIGELSALTWGDVNFAESTLDINKSSYYDFKSKAWVISEPKTASGIRIVPLTDEAIRILREQKKKNTNKLIFSDKIPVQTSAYNISLKSIAKKIGIKNISVHVLRHTFATRCIESGMNPKMLQSILGHSNIAMTMDRYVHATHDEKVKEMQKIQKSLCL